MKTRGQNYFTDLPGFGAKLYDSLMEESPMHLYYQEIAQDLSGRITQGRLLDIGTGPGR